MEPESVSLMEKAQKGDRGAFEELLARERPRLEAFVHGKVGADLARGGGIEDVLQETLLRGFRDLGKFRHRGENSFSRWLCGIAGHVILELAGRNSRRKTVPLDSRVSARGVSPSRAARRDERFDRLRSALDSLSPEHRSVILLVRIDGLAVAEVARRMDRTPHAVSNLLLRACRRLKEILGDTESMSLPARTLGEEGR